MIFDFQKFKEKVDKQLFSPSYFKAQVIPVANFPFSFANVGPQYHDSKNCDHHQNSTTKT